MVVNHYRSVELTVILVVFDKLYLKEWIQDFGYTSPNGEGEVGVRVALDKDWTSILMYYVRNLIFFRLVLRRVFFEDMLQLPLL